MKRGVVVSVMNWLKLRKLKVEHILITNDSFDHAIENVDFSSLTSICLSVSYPSIGKVKMIPDASITFMIQNCPNLTSVNLAQGRDLLISEASLLNILNIYQSQLITLIIGRSLQLSTKQLIPSIVQNQKCLTTLHLNACLLDSDVELLVLYCINVTDLDISFNDKLTADRSAMAIVNYLVCLEVVRFHQTSTDIGAQMFKVLRRGFEKIIWLDLMHHVARGIPLRERVELTKDDVYREIHPPPKPVELGDDVFNLGDDVFFNSCNDVVAVAMPMFVHGSVLDRFIWHCPLLRVLHLSGFYDYDADPLDSKVELNDSSLFIMASKCHLLESVDFSHRECISDVSMSALVSANPKLVRVVCENCSNIGAGTVNTLSKFCANLEFLNLSGCTNINDDCLMRLSFGCQKLKYVGLKNLDDVSNDKVTMLSMKSFKANCAQLQSIHRTAPQESYEAGELQFHVRTFGQADKTIYL
jgi:hypothetical protein